MVCGSGYCKILLLQVWGLHPLMCVCSLCRILQEHFCVYKKMYSCLFSVCSGSAIELSWSVNGTIVALSLNIMTE